MEPSLLTGSARLRLDERPSERVGGVEEDGRYWIDETADCVNVEVDGVSFRLRRSRLRAQSQTIDRLLAGKMPAAERQETIVIEGVDAHDFQEMLKVMNDAVTYVLEPPPSETIAAVLRAASALSCKSLARFSEKLLLDLWSPNLQRLTRVPMPSAQEVVLIARELGIPEVLKRALYELLRHPGASDKLSPDDMHRIHKAHGELQMAWAGFVWNTPNSHAFQCQARTSAEARACAAAMDRDRFQTWRELLEEHELFTPSDPLDSLQSLADLDWASVGYCPSCVAARREVFARKRQELWEKLDQWLDL